MKKIIIILLLLLAITFSVFSASITDEEYEELCMMLVESELDSRTYMFMNENTSIRIYDPQIEILIVGPRVDSMQTNTFTKNFQTGDEVECFVNHVFVFNQHLNEDKDAKSLKRDIINSGDVHVKTYDVCTSFKVTKAKLGKLIKNLSK